MNGGMRQTKTNRRGWSLFFSKKNERLLPEASMKNFDSRYNDIPKTEIHCHLEGAIRTQTILEIAKDYHLQLPTYDVNELDRHVKIYDQMRNLEAVLAAFAIFQNSITSPAVVERIAWELFEDS